jgi:hypothetical protein
MESISSCSRDVSCCELMDSIQHETSLEQELMDSIQHETSLEQELMDSIQHETSLEQELMDSITLIYLFGV